MNAAVSTDIDLFDNQSIRQPEPLWKELRALGSAVWMNRYDMWAISRYDDVKTVLGDWKLYTTSKGVAMDEKVNAATSGPGKANSLTSDPPLHNDIRKITGVPLRPGAIRDMEGFIREKVEEHFTSLLQKKNIDAIADIARFIPMNLVREFVGLPEEGRNEMLAWAAATFDAMGPMNERGKAAIPKIQELHQYCIHKAIPPHLKKDGWADKIYQAADQGKIERAQCPGMMREYIGPALDTTIFGLGHMLRQLSLHREQWEMLKEDRSLVPAAINETLRLNSPINSFTRYVNQDSKIGDSRVKAGDRLIVLYGSANRCERQWGKTADAFDIKRDSRHHLAFGHGIHACGGMHLARLEMQIVLETMLDRIAYFETEAPEIFLNNTLKGFASMKMRIFPL